MTTCQEVQGWLLAARETDPTPAAVSQHLPDCGKCRRLYRRLQRLAEAVRALPLPAANLQAKAQLLEQVNALNATPVRPHARRVFMYAPRWCVAAAAALVLFVGGLMLGRFTAGPVANDRVVENGKLKGGGRPPKKNLPTDIMVRVVHHDVQLAATTQPDRQIEIFSELLDDLFSETLRLLQRGSPDKVPEVAGLYEFVAEQGLTRSAAALGKKERVNALPPALRRLRAAESHVDRLSETSLPVVAHLLSPIRAAARDCAQRLRSDDPVRDTLPKSSPPPHSMLGRLVIQGLRIASDNDPLRRAHLCSEITPIVARNIVMLAANGEADRAVRLGQGLGALIRTGVESNLLRAGAKRLTDANKVRGRVAAALADMEKNLRHASLAARPGIERALQAARRQLSDKNPPKQTKSNKAKHLPPGKKKKSNRPRGKGPPFLPPGWLKKHRHAPPGQQKKIEARFRAPISFFKLRSNHETFDKTLELCRTGIPDCRRFRIGNQC